MTLKARPPLGKLDPIAYAWQQKQKELAAALGINQSVISRIRTGKSWRHVS